MSFKNQIVVIILCFCLSFLFLRGFIYGIKRFQLNNSAYKKRKKGESFKEWLFYSRYTEEIPKLLRVLHGLVLIIHLSCFVTCVFLYFTKVSFNIGGILAILIAIFDSAWMLVIAVLFWSPGPGYPYERWISKKRGQKRGNK